MRATQGGLSPGLDLARYRIESLVAVGGMSEVYAAYDPLLRRKVALKVVRDGEHARRFVREAEAASSLNHPVIVPVYDSGSAVLEGTTVQYLVMEFVEGETLANWARGTRDWRRKAQKLSVIAEGVARAHASGIVHRDIKPDNLMIARGGHPRILDFGIAKLTEVRTDGATDPDALLGTTAYMSPEQAERTAVDHRSDIFSFGAVLYEVISGRAAFRRSTTVDTLHAIAHEQPSMAGLEPSLVRIIRRCLAKSPDDRYDSMHDVALDLREAAGTDAGGAASGAAARLRLLLFALALTIALFAWLNLGRAAEPAPMPPSVISPATTMERVTSNGRTFAGAISPDGRFVSYSTVEGLTQTLWLMQIATGTSTRLLPPAEVSYGDLRFSPDGHYVYYSMATRAESNVVDLYRISAIGGEPRKIAADMEGGFALSPDGRQVTFRRFNALIRDSVLFVASADGGSERELLRKRYPEGISGTAWIPGTREVAFGYFSGRPNDPVRVVSVDSETGAMKSISTAQWKRIADWRGIGSYVWLPDGSGTVATVAAQRQPSQVWWAPQGAAPRKVTSDVSSYSDLSVTADGTTILATRHEDSTNIWLASLRDGTARPLTTGNTNRHGAGGLAWRRDEVIFTTTGQDRPGLASVTRDGKVSAMNDEMVHWQPNVSSDGRRMVFASDKSGSIEVWSADADGANAMKVTAGGRATMPQLFPDGRSLLFLWSSRGQTLWRTSLDGKELEQVTFMPTAAPALSRDGKWIVCRLRSKDGESPLWRTVLLTAEGRIVRELSLPRFGAGPNFGWAPDGRLLYVDYRDGIANLWSAERDGGDARQITRFDAGRISSFAASPDGTSVAIARGDPVSDLVLIRNFR